MRLGSSCRALPEREFEREERNGKAEERDEVRDQERCTSVSVAQEWKSGSFGSFGEVLKLHRYVAARASSERSS